MPHDGASKCINNARLTRNGRSRHGLIAALKKNGFESVVVLVVVAQRFSGNVSSFLEFLSGFLSLDSLDG